LNFIVVWRFLLNAWKLIHVLFMLREKSAIIVVKMLGATIRSLFARVTWPTGFAQHSFTVSQKLIYEHALDEMGQILLPAVGVSAVSTSPPALLADLYRHAALVRRTQRRDQGAFI
jgi:hypothetical protein